MPTRVILVGPLPPPYHGLSVAFQTAVGFFKEENLPTVTVNISEGTNNKKVGSFSLKRLIRIIAPLSKYIRQLNRPGQIVYLTVAISLLGFFRDAVFIWLAILRNCRVVLHIHGGGYDEFINAQPLPIKKFIYFTLQKTDAIIVLGEHLKNQVKDIVDEQKIKIVPNCLAQPILLPSKPRTRSIGAPLQVLYLSNLIETKGFWDLLTAINLLRRKGLQIYADFCGEFVSSSDASKYLDIKDARNTFLLSLKNPIFNNSVIFHGVVTDKKKLRVLWDADVFVLPTYYQNEGQPISIIEAMASALPVISTPYRGIPDMVIEGVNGFLIPPRSPESIAARLEELYNSPELCHQMSRASFEIYRKRFDSNVTKESLLISVLGNDQTGIRGIEYENTRESPHTI